jgi:hypothetical protein
LNGRVVYVTGIPFWVGVPSGGDLIEVPICNQPLPNVFLSSLYSAGLEAT